MLNHNKTNASLFFVHMYSCICHGSIYPWFNFSFLWFLGIVIYDNEFERKESIIQTNDKIEPQHNNIICKMKSDISVEFECTTNSTLHRKFLEERPWEQVCPKEITLPILIQSSISSLVGGGLGQEGMQTLDSTITT